MSPQPQEDNNSSTLGAMLQLDGSRLCSPGLLVLTVGSASICLTGVHIATHPAPEVLCGDGAAGVWDLVKGRREEKQGKRRSTPRAASFAVPGPEYPCFNREVPAGSFQCGVLREPPPRVHPVPSQRDHFGHRESVLSKRLHL